MASESSGKPPADERLLFSSGSVDVYEYQASSGSEAANCVKVGYHGNPVGAVVIARRSDNRFVLLRVFRPIFGTTELELPRGTGHRGEGPESAAVRELEEETGLLALSSSVLGTVYPDSGLLTTVAYVVLVELVDGTEGQPSDAEGIRGMEWTTLEGAWELVRSGQIRDSFTLCALALLNVAPKAL